MRLLLVNQFGVNTGFYMLVPYLAAHLTGDLGLTAAVVGVVLGLRNVSQQGMFLLGGSLADRFGPRPAIIAGCLIRTAGFGLFAFGTSLPLLIAASLLSGFAGALFNPAVRSYIAQQSGERRAEAFALFTVFANAGAMAGPLLGSALLVADFRIAALVSALIFAVLTVAQLLALPEAPKPDTSRSVFAGWPVVLRDRRLVGFSLALIGMFALETQLYLLLPLEAERVTGTGGAVAGVFVVSTVTTLALQVRLTDWWKARPDRGRAIRAGLATLGAAFLVPPASGLLALSGTAKAVTNVAALVVATVLLAVGLMIAQPFVMELIPAFAPAGLTGTYYGFFYLVSGLTAAAGNAAIGALLDGAATDGTRWVPWICCAALGFASAAAVAGLERKTRWLVPVRA